MYTQEQVAEWDRDDELGDAERAQILERLPVKRKTKRR